MPLQLLHLSPRLLVEGREEASFFMYISSRFIIIQKNIYQALSRKQKSTITVHVRTIFILYCARLTLVADLPLLKIAPPSGGALQLK